MTNVTASRQMQAGTRIGGPFLGRKSRTSSCPKKMDLKIKNHSGKYGSRLHLGSHWLKYLRDSISSSMTLGTTKVSVAWSANCTFQIGKESGVMTEVMEILQHL